MRKVFIVSFLLLLLLSIGQWQQISTDINGVDTNEYSGYSVSLSNDGSTVVIGSTYYDSVKGTIRLFKNKYLNIQINTFGELFSVAPNPSYVDTKIELGANYKEVTVQVFTILGKLISTQNYTNTNEITLDTQKYTTGVYIVKVQSGIKQASLKLMVK